MKQNELFKEKETSSFPVAIGTGLALESMFDPVIDPYDPDREIPNKIELKDYKYHIWNIYTIIRNLLHSVDEKDKISLITDKNFTKELNQEIDTLVNLYNNTDLTVVIFIPDYDKVMDSFNKHKVSEFTKPMVELLAVRDYLKNYTPDGLINSITGGFNIPRMEGNILLTTHLTVDLLNQHNKITLLESNTGKVKSKYEWYTKYHPIGKRDLDTIPMVEEVLYILGDHNMVIPAPLTTRLELYQVAIDRRWTSKTTREKIVADLRSVGSLYPYVEKHKRMYF